MPTEAPTFLPKRAPQLPAHRKIAGRVQDREPMPDDERRQISKRFIIHARQELKSGRRLQAGEKAWGAAAHYLKAIGDQRGWKHHSHQQLHALGSILAAEEEQNHETDIAAFQEALTEAYRVGHENFYENHRSEQDIADTIDAVEAILPRLDRIASSPFRPFKIASGKQLGRLETLTGRTDLRIKMTSDVGFAQPITRKPPRSVRRRQRKAEEDTVDNAVNGKEDRASGRSRRSKNADKGNGSGPPTEVNVLLT